MIESGKISFDVAWYLFQKGDKIWGRVIDDHVVGAEVIETKFEIFYIYIVQILRIYFWCLINSRWANHQVVWQDFLHAQTKVQDTAVFTTFVVSKWLSGKG